MKSRRLVTCLLLVCALCAPLASAQSGPSDPKTAAFDKLLLQVQTDPTGTSQDQVVELIEMGKDLDRSYTVSLALKGYLSHQFRPQPSLLLASAENAFWAGDYRAAVARYKAYLAEAADDETASNAAATMYTIQVDLLDAKDDAYQSMKQADGKFRKTAWSRKFDTWFIESARRKKDYTGWANGLARVMSEKMPLEKERLYYWDDLDALINALESEDSKQFDALPALRRLAGQIRESDWRVKRLGFYIAYLDFRANASGKNEDAMKSLFKSVTNAAKSYIDAYPTANTVKDIFTVWGNMGERIDGSIWQQQIDQKREFFVYAFSKLDDQHRRVLLNWDLRHTDDVAQRLASNAQWAELATKHAKFFKQTPNLWRNDISYETQADSLDYYKKLSAALVTDGSNSAAVINAIANSKDLADAGNLLVSKYSWAMDPGSAEGLFERHIWPAYQAIAAKSGKELTNKDWEQAYLQFSRQSLSTTPIALYDKNAARSFIRLAWKHAGDDKTSIIKDIESLTWVPWNNRDRQDVFRDAYGDFKRWADWLRREARKKDPKTKVTEQQLAQISKIQDVFSSAQKEGGDPSKAPNALTKAWAGVVVALQNNNKELYEKSSRDLYKIVRDYEKSRVPFGREGLRVVFEGRNQPIDNIDLQAEFLADQLAMWDGKGHDARIAEVMETIISSRNNWGWRNIPGNDRDQAKKLHDVVAKSVLDNLNKKRFWAQAFHWQRGLRVGRGWQALDWGEEVMVKIIETKAFHDSDYRSTGSSHSATTSYMHLVRYEFPRLNSKYPVATYFDDMFVAEAKQTKFLDDAYAAFGGRDEKKKIANVAADVLAEFKTLPLGYSDGDVRYSRTDLETWETRALSAEPEQREAMLDSIEKTYGKTRFDRYAMGRGYFAHPHDVTTEDGRKAYFDELARYLDRLREAPKRYLPPQMGTLSDVEHGKLNDQEAAVLVGIFPELVPGYWPSGRGYETLAHAVITIKGGGDKKRGLYPLLPFLWEIAADTRNSGVRDRLVNTARKLLEDNENDLALVIGVTGEEIASRELGEDAKQALATVRSKALAGVGGVNPYQRNDPRYHIGAAQGAYLTNRLDTARELYRENWTTLLTTHKELDPNFIIWIIEEETKVGRYDDATELAQRMIQWVDNTAGFDLDTRGRLMLAYAAISLAEKQYPTARALYERIAQSEDYKGTRVAFDAELQIADIDRLTETFDEAIKRLDELVKVRDPFLQTKAYYYLARVKFDEKQFKEAKEVLQNVFAREPDHALGRILEAKINNEMRYFGENEDVVVSPDTLKKYIVPGKPLRIQLEDQTLAVVGKASNIEIRVWTDSGDAEVFNLLPKGDSKTKFTGSIGTELAPTARGDFVVQLLGEDKVYYDYSDAFKKAQKIVETTPHELIVLTDAELLASSGKIVTSEERKEAELEAALRQKFGLGGAENVKGVVALSTLRSASEIKPGNAINVRVIDPDRSATPGKDEVEVRINSSSGDVIGAFTLTETDTHSGVFEASVPTAAGQAMAYASGSRDGSEPNFAISKGDYEPWVALGDGQKPKWYAVDLNDNVLFGKMALTANVPGRKLKSFRVQTSLNGQTFKTVGSWPQPFVAWNGEPQVVIARVDSEKARFNGAEDIEQYLEMGYIAANAPKVAAPLKGLNVNWDSKLGGTAARLKLNKSGRGSNFIARFSGEFYLERPQVRMFKLNPKGGDSLSYIFAIDGVMAKGAKNVEGITMRQRLDKGLHRVDVYVVGASGSKPSFEILTDSDEPPYMKVVSDEFFDKSKQPALPRPEAAKITADDAKEVFDIAFPPGARGRVVRFVMDDFEGEAPAIDSITLADAGGEQVLPTKEDFMALRRNNVLEIVPGDRVTVTYRDPKYVSPSKEQLERFLSATYNNATISAAFVEYQTDSKGQRTTRYVPMRRFEPQDVINVFIRDPDMDVTEKQDKVTYTAKPSEGEMVSLEAVETEEHSGIFVGKVFPVKGQPKRPSELSVRAGDQVLLSYMDTENTDPGVEWPREAKVEQVWWEEPELRVFDVAARPLSEEEMSAGSASQGGSRGKQDDEEIGQEMVATTHTMIATRPELPQPDRTAQIMLDGPLIVEVLYPAAAKSPESTVKVYAQTATGRQAGGSGGPDVPFDITVPGTIELAVQPASVGGEVAAPVGYKEIIVRGDPFAITPLDDGRFTVVVPKQLGPLPEKSLVGADAELALREAGEGKHLAIKGDDDVFIGFKFTDPQGKEHWMTRRVTMAADAFFDVTDRKYQEPLTGVYVGETVYFRVIDRRQDLTDEKDVVNLTLTTTSGKTKEIELTETFSHSGEFKGLVKVAYIDDPDAMNDVAAMPAAYGDIITAVYKPNGGSSGLERTVEVYKGSDGELLSFTKRFKDPKIGVKTQFTVAEAYFELAKRHRELGQESLARREILQGKKLLEEAIRDFPDNEYQAQADYLLANLAMEFADDAVNEDDKQKYYLEAVNKFTDIVATFPESEYAPKSQYKKALVFEKMGQIDLACEEYVKLSYRYPDNELVAETIARLGRYFLNKGKDFRDAAQAEADAGKPVEAEKIRIQSRDMFKTAGEVFSRLSARFPSHDLAGKTDVLSAQCYMQAEMYQEAISGFLKVIDNSDLDNDLRAESMYWCGDSYWKAEDGLNAFRMFKRLTWDYPASKWAKYARGRLADPELSKYEES